MTDETNFTDSRICIDMESIEVVSSVRRAPPENLHRSLHLISSGTSPIFEKYDSDFENPYQAIPKAASESPPVRISDEAAAIQSTSKPDHPTYQLRSSSVSGNTYVKAMANGIVPNAPVNGDNKAKENSFAYFKTRSGKLENQLSRLRSMPQERDNEAMHHPKEPDLPARRYFDALQGPELEILREIRTKFRTNFPTSVDGRSGKPSAGHPSQRCLNRGLNPRGWHYSQWTPESLTKLQPTINIKCITY